MQHDAQPVTKEEFNSALNGGLNSLRADFKADMAEMFRKLSITLAHHSAELADIRGYIKDKLVTRDEFHSRMDAITGR